MDFLSRPKILLVFAATFSCGLLVFALILTRVAELVPCPLCIVQRFFFALAGLTAAAGAVGFLPAFSAQRAGLAVAVTSFIGGAVAARHVWLQRFPVSADSTGCHVSFGSFFDSVIQALGGVGNCAIVDWTLLGFSIPEWSLASFVLLVVIGLWVARGKREATPAT
jgi:protein dithiol:quinone oxidoreductase